MTKDIVQRVAMKAVIVNDEGKILILREATTYEDGNNAGRYHFPGGRVDPGEHFEDALRREVREETGLEVELDHPLYVGEWRPVIREIQHHIVATFIVCELASKGKIALSSEHDHYEWIEPEERHKFDLLPPDDLVVDAYAAKA